MSKKQNYAVIGLGRFGYSVAVTLLDMGQNVIAIDRDPEVLERISREGADVFIVNSISRSSLTECGLSDCDAVVIGIGTFLTTVIDFILVAFVVFLVVKAFNTAKKKLEKPAEPETPPEEPEPTKEELLLTEIRDLLKKQ